MKRASAPAAIVLACAAALTGSAWAAGTKAAAPKVVPPELAAETLASGGTLSAAATDACTWPT